MFREFLSKRLDLFSCLGKLATQTVYFNFEIDKSHFEIEKSYFESYYTQFEITSKNYW